MQVTNRPFKRRAARPGQGTQSHCPRRVAGQRVTHGQHTDAENAQILCRCPCTGGRPSGRGAGALADISRASSGMDRWRQGERLRQGRQGAHVLCDLRRRRAGPADPWGTGNADVWEDQVNALATRHKVIVADSRGHGRSTRSGNDIHAPRYGRRLCRAAGPPEARQGRGRRLERWRHHRSRPGRCVTPPGCSRLFAHAADSKPGVAPAARSRTAWNAYAAWARTSHAALTKTRCDGTGASGQGFHGPVGRFERDVANRAELVGCRPEEDCRPHHDRARRPRRGDLVPAHAVSREDHPDAKLWVLAPSATPPCGRTRRTTARLSSSHSRGRHQGSGPARRKALRAGAGEMPDEPRRWARQT